MKKKSDINLNYHNITVRCSCAYEFNIRSTLAEDTLSIEVCSRCHPFYTGKQKIIDTSGMVDSFHRRFGKLSKK